VPLPPNVRIGADHDMSFHLEYSSWLRQLKSRAKSESVLVVERFDAERVGVRTESLARARALGRHLPRPLRRLGRFALDRWRAHGSEVRSSMVTQALNFDPSLAARPVVQEDISIATRHSFEEFVERIVEADAVITTRLHPGILATLLGKPVYLQGTTHPYDKLRSVYQLSLRKYPNAHLLPDLRVGSECAPG
jgi:exopolysaccharide biosynthesis predicted pyruvyltransferase EpsI